MSLRSDPHSFESLPLSRHHVVREEAFADGLGVAAGLPAGLSDGLSVVGLALAESPLVSDGPLEESAAEGLSRALAELLLDRLSVA